MSKIHYDESGVLHITNITEAVQIEKSDFDSIITVCQDSILDNISSSIYYEHYIMSDGESETEEKYGGSCSYELFKAAADSLYYSLNNDETVLIHCHAGQSRSVSVSAAALGRLLDVPYNEALDLIHTYRITYHSPDRQLMNHARTYLEENR
jgi:protein-tyrosine phosphatase